MLFAILVMMMNAVNVNDCDLLILITWYMWGYDTHIYIALVDLNRGYE